jgi:protein TonB
MRSTLYQKSAYAHRAPLWRRATALTLAFGANLLILLLLLKITPMTPRPPAREAGPVVFQLQTNSQAEPAKSRASSKPRRASSDAARASAPAAKKPPPVPSDAPLQMMIVSRDVFLASDIARMPSRGKDQGEADAEAGGAPAAGGQGPNGEQLYDADWYRKPTHAELAYYLPSGAPRTGWGMIACQTVADFRVENCQELADSPPGSGLARAVRQAAWQFRVRPPRIGGRTLVGAWVRIRIDFTPEGAK